MTSMQIFCKTITGKTFAIDCEPTQSVADFKEMIHSKEGIPADQLRLVFAGKELDNTKTLSEYNIQRASTVMMLLRLRGGF